MIKKHSVVIRADASASMGTGHIMRMRALAHALNLEGWLVNLFYQTCPQSLTRVLKNENVCAFKMPATKNFAEDACHLIAAATYTRADFVIIDGYQFNYQYQKALTDAGFKVLVMDDYQHCQRYCADVILNQNCGAKELTYVCDGETKLLLDTDYTLLRPEFLKVRNGRPKANTQIGSGFNITITLGGASVSQYTTLALESTAKSAAAIFEKTGKKLIVRAIAGPAETESDKLGKIVSTLNLKSDNARFLLIKGVEDMATFISGSDLVISAGGGTVWEAACCGVANLVLTIADNQKAVQNFAAKGAIWLLDQQQSLDATEISDAITKFITSGQWQNMSRVAASAVDGQGASRVASALKQALKQT